MTSCFRGSIRWRSPVSCRNFACENNPYYIVHDTWYDIWHMIHNKGYMRHDTWYIIHDTDTWYIVDDTWYLLHYTCYTPSCLLHLSCLTFPACLRFLTISCLPKTSFLSTVFVSSSFSPILRSCYIMLVWYLLLVESLMLFYEVRNSKFFIDMHLHLNRTSSAGRRHWHAYPFK